MMNDFRPNLKNSILIFRLILTVSILFAETQTQVVSASSGLLQQQPYIAPFLYPPYAGIVGENSIMDHNSPVNAVEEQNGVILAFTGDVAYGDPEDDELVYQSPT